MYVITWSNMCSMWIGIFLITTSIIYNYGKKKLVKIFRNIVNKSIMFWFPKKSVSSIFKYYVIVSAIAKLLHSRCLENNFFMEIIQIVRAKLYTTLYMYLYWNVAFRWNGLIMKSNPRILLALLWFLFCVSIHEITRNNLPHQK